MNKHERKDACRRFNSVFVFGILVLILLNLLRPAKPLERTESLQPEAMPKMAAADVLDGTYMQETEQYAARRFAFREPFVLVKSKLEYLIGQQENNGIYVCDNDYLIEKLPSVDENVVVEQLKKLRALDATNQYRIAISFVPPAYEILKELLPRHVYRDDILKFRKQVASGLSGTNIVNADATDLLRKYKNDYLYYKTDAHLTANGAYVVYHELARSMGIAPLQGDDFKISDVSRTFLGVNYRKALKSTTPDVLLDYRPLETPRFKVRFPYEGTEADSMYFPAHLEHENKYPYFLDGSHPLTIIESPNKNGKKLMVFKDDNANAIVPFLANHFETIYMVDLKLYPDDALLFAKEQGIEDMLFLYGATTVLSNQNIFPN